MASTQSQAQLEKETIDYVRQFWFFYGTLFDSMWSTHCKSTNVSAKTVFDELKPTMEKIIKQHGGSQTITNQIVPELPTIISGDKKALNNAFEFYCDDQSNAKDEKLVLAVLLRFKKVVDNDRVLLERYSKIRKKIVILLLITIIRQLKDQIQLKHERKRLDGNIPRCPGCGKVGDMRCGGCLGAWYCSMNCQESHWTVHQKSCSLKCNKPVLLEHDELHDEDLEKLLDEEELMPVPDEPSSAPGIFGEDDTSSAASRIREEAVKEGYLWKQGGWFNTWKKRYFVLTANSMAYYRIASKEEQARWNVSLEGAKFQLEPAFETGRPYSFSILPKDSRRKFILAGDTEEVSQVWAACIRTQLGEKVADQKIQEILTVKKQKPSKKSEKIQRDRFQEEAQLHDSEFSKEEKRRRNKEIRKLQGGGGGEGVDGAEYMGPVDDALEDLDDFPDEVPGHKTSVPLKSHKIASSSSTSLSPSGHSPEEEDLGVDL